MQTEHRAPNFRLRRICLALALPLGLGAQAQIRTDGSLGVAPAQNFNGGFVDITQSHGKLVGGNLFHSFQTFNVAQSQAVYFTTNTPGLANVISRVTGGSPSAIYGQLGLFSVAATPNFFLINPAGVTFGPGAVIDVPGSFHVSTANYVKFADGNFHADLAQTSTFSSAAPEAFGFLGTTRASVNVFGGVTLATAGAQAISLVAGDIAIDGSVIATESGDIRLAAVGQQPTEVPFSGPIGVLDGYLDIYSGSVVYSQSTGFDKSGSVILGAGDIWLSGGSTIASQSLFVGAAGDLDLSAARSLAVLDGSQIFSRTFYVGDAGSIKLQATDITIGGQDGAPGGVASLTEPGSFGNAGNIRIEATGELNISGASRVSTTTQSSGNAGNVFASAANITIDGQYYGPTGIFSESPVGAGDAGSIELMTPGTLTITRDGFVSTTSVAGGNAGPISIHAGSVSLGDDPFTTAGIVSSVLAGGGRSGGIDITLTGKLSVFNNGIVSSTSGGTSGAGAVTVHAGSVLVDGGGFGFPTISSDTFGPGTAGRVDIAASGDVTVLGGGVISSSTYGAGDAGSVTVTAANVLVDGQALRFAGIQSDSFGDEFATSGKAGNVEVTAIGEVAVVQGGHISSATFYGGNGGSVSVQAASVLVDGRGTGNDTSILSESVFGYGDGGRVNVEASGQVRIIDGGDISARTRSFGNAGVVRVGAGSLLIDGYGLASGISTSSDFNPVAGNAGNIDIVVSGDMSVLGSGLVSSGTSTTGNAGMVKISAGNLLIDQQGGADITGVVSDTYAEGNAGTVDLTVTGNLAILNRAVVTSQTRGTGDAGSVTVHARNITLDGGVDKYSSEISSNTGEPYITGDAGNAGRVSVTATGELVIRNGGAISSSTRGTGNAGTVDVVAGSILIDGGGGFNFTGISTQASPFSSGNGGQVNVEATGTIQLLRGGTIDSNTFESGNAGSVRVRAHDILIDGRDSFQFLDGEGRILSGIFSAAAALSSGDAGMVDVEATSQVSVIGGGAISSGTQAAGSAGTVRVAAGTLLVDGAGSSINAAAIEDSSGQTGDLRVSASGSITVSNRGSLSIRNDATVADPGSIVPTTLSVVAPSIAVSGGSITAASAGNVNASNIEIDTTGELVIRETGVVTSDTAGVGNAGMVHVRAGSILIEALANNVFNGISSQAQDFSTGNAGSVSVVASGDITLKDRGAQITSSTFSSGNAGSVVVEAGGTFSLLGGQISSDTLSSGNAGTVTAVAGNIVIDGGAQGGAGIFSDTFGTGHGGRVSVQTPGQLSITRGGQISSSAHISGDAGPVLVVAGTIAVDGQGAISSGIFSESRGPAGNAGDVSVHAGTALSLVNAGQISSSSVFNGNAGKVTVTAASSILVDAQGNNGLFTTAGIFSETQGTGNAGEVSVETAGQLSVLGGGRISSSTFLSGSAGSVVVKAGTLQVDGANSSIAASASSDSFGQTGNVTVAASESILLSNGGNLSITNDATVADPAAILPTILSVSAPNITLKNASITAASFGNVAASDIQISFTQHLFVDPSSITTSAVDGNGGSINIAGGQLITLENSQITTSVTGLSGNGGDITLSANTLILDTGFIQANTGAANASGGLVNINVQTLLASGNSLFTGGNVPFVFQPGVFGFNVIQAAAPTGLSGVVQVTTPPLDVSGSLAGLSTQALDIGGLARNPCQVTGGSSLAQAGRGGLPPSARGLLRYEPESTPTARNLSDAVVARSMTGSGSCL